MSAKKRLEAAIKVGQETINKLRTENAALRDRIRELESRPTKDAPDKGGSLAEKDLSALEDDLIYGENL